MRIKIVAVLIVWCTTVQAQMIDVKSKNGFFMGKRIAVSAQAMVQPVIRGTIDYEKFMEFPGISPRLDATYALNNGSSVKVFTSFSKLSRGKSYFFYMNGSGKYQELGENPVIRSTNLGVQYNFHFKGRGALAPAGGYFGLGLGIRSASEFHDGMEVGYYGNSYDLLNSVDVSHTEVSTTSLLFIMEYSHRFPVTDQVFWEMGASNLWTTDFVEGLRDYYYDTQEVDDLEEMQTQLLRNRIGTWDFLRVSVGVGMFL